MKADGTEVQWTRDTSHPELGDAWRAPDGVIWGDMVKNSDGSPQFLDQPKAAKYCKDIGAELPSRDDFIRMAEYLGAKPGIYSKEIQPYPLGYSLPTGYTPQVLPNMTYSLREGWKSLNRYFWSSTPTPYDSNPEWVFFAGLDGVADDGSIHWSGYGNITFRCVKRT